ncbi:MAG: leucyl aminopeptidase [Trueperaceae bacterium]|nr:MAG: leucyl aminopeptidase [Trueperaceae bacterium]
MDIRVDHGAIQDSGADTLIVNLFQGVGEPTGATAAVDEALGGAIGDLIAQGDFRGKTGEVAVLYPRGELAAKRVLLVGLGERERFGTEAVRRAAAAAAARARELSASHLATIVHGGGAGGLSPASAAQATVEGSLLALYRYRASKQVTEEPNEIASLTVVEFDQERLAEVESGARAAEAIAAGVMLARDLVNMPPNVATPGKLAEVATELARDHDLRLFVGDRDWAAEQKMGTFLAVAKGAEEPPAFIVLEHNPERSENGTVVLVGKGITFDTGGISLKPSAKMEEMKCDMAGAAAVLGAMKAIARLGLPHHVVAIAPCTENMPDGRSYHPADVITASNGKTVEIISTDAEGRLVLADALVYAGRYAPKVVIDLATLTGSCIVALGQGMAAGLFSNDDALRDALCAAGETTRERVWPLPLWEEYTEEIESRVADLKNSGGRQGGVATSAVFLQAFTDYPWAHLDIAGMALSDKANSYTPAGGTGYGVRLLAEWLRGL